MKKIIKKFCAVLAALVMIVSVVTVMCNVAFAYDDETEIVLPLWEDEEKPDLGNRS